MQVTYPRRKVFHYLPGLKVFSSYNMILFKQTKVKWKNKALSPMFAFSFPVAAWLLYGKEKLFFVPYSSIVYQETRQTLTGTNIKVSPKYLLLFPERGVEIPRHQMPCVLCVACLLSKASCWLPEWGREGLQAGHIPSHFPLH